MRLGLLEKLFKFAVYVPEKYADKVSQALFDAGAGKIGNYSETSFGIFKTSVRPIVTFFILLK